MGWLSTTFDEDNAATEAETPATAPRYLGGAFMQQSPVGVWGNQGADPVVQEASVGAGLPLQYSTMIAIPADQDGVGYSSTHPDSVFGGIVYGDPVLVDDGRPVIGFPLPHISDQEYADRTNDYTANNTHELMGPLSTQDQHWLAEKPLGVLMRASGRPAEIQPPRPWDVFLGMWPWSGDKAALTRPTASTPLTFDTPLVDPNQSPTGTSNADAPTFFLNPYPMTYRAPVTPWDTNNYGAFVDGGD